MVACYNYFNHHHFRFHLQRPHASVRLDPHHFVRNERINKWMSRLLFTHGVTSIAARLHSPSSHMTFHRDPDMRPSRPCLQPMMKALHVQDVENRVAPSSKQTGLKGEDAVGSSGSQRWLSLSTSFPFPSYVKIGLVLGVPSPQACHCLEGLSPHQDLRNWSIWQALSMGWFLRLCRLATLPHWCVTGTVIHSLLNKYLLGTYYVSGTLVRTGDTAENKAGKNPCPQGAYILVQDISSWDFLGLYGRHHEFFLLGH